LVRASLIAAVLVLRVTNPYGRDLLRETIEGLLPAARPADQPQAEAA
jgi:hypothetical protein